MDTNLPLYAGGSLLSAVVSAKWAMDLGYSQLSQFFWGVGGLILGPLMPFFLYIRLIYKCRAEGRLGGQAIGKDAPASSIGEPVR